MVRVVERTASERRTVRCAIYTRKSTEEGLEQEFNSLDAQREACAAYILSQRHEGWAAVKTAYEDGGFSGGNMERPGLKRLLADMAAGQVDVIVVYKVDRLTRALSDFAKIVEILDARGASFVSVTQAFNTTTSMGRLTLNVLLSFAQFEREVTGERIRDKIAASRAKGMWMGGNVPLGYDVVERKLVVNDADAAIVQHIFARYLALGNGGALIEELRSQGYRTKVRVQRTRTIGGIPFARGMLFSMLANPVYIGEVVHRGTSYPGEHPALIERATWDAVQAKIAGNRSGPATRRSPHASLFAGRLSDGLGRKMTPSHATKSGRRYRYYITAPTELSDDSEPAWRLPAQDVEHAVILRVQKMLRDKAGIAALVGTLRADHVARAIACAERDAQRLEQPNDRRSLLDALIDRVCVDQQSIAIQVNARALGRQLGVDLVSPQPVTLSAPALKLRIGKATKLVLSDGHRSAVELDDGLIALLGEALQARKMMDASPTKTIREMAAAHRQCRTRFARLIRLSWLAPEIVSAIVEGRHPQSLTPKQLLDAQLPLAWHQQKALLGFA